MAKGEPPHADLHPVGVLFLIPKYNPPQLDDHFSKPMKEFVSLCLKKNPAETALQRHLLRTTASELVDAVLLTQEELEKKFETGDACAEIQNSAISSSTPQKLHLTKSLEGSLSTKCLKMVEALDGKSVTDFEQSLQDVAEECGLRLRQLDKKSEKPFSQCIEKGLYTEIGKENDPVALLPKVVAMLFVQVINKALQAPGRTISATIKCLKV